MSAQNLPIEKQNKTSDRISGQVIMKKSEKKKKIIRRILFYIKDTGLCSLFSLLSCKKNMNFHFPIGFHFSKKIV